MRRAVNEEVNASMAWGIRINPALQQLMPPMPPTPMPPAQQPKPMQPPPPPPPLPVQPAQPAQQQLEQDDVRRALFPLNGNATFDTRPPKRMQPASALVGPPLRERSQEGGASLAVDGRSDA